MSNDHSEGIEYFSKYFKGNVYYTKYKFGSNYFPAKIAMPMKGE